jgi:hypothetical protein
MIGRRSREIFARFDVDGAEIVGVHPQANENAWLLGLVAARKQRFHPQRVMGLVGARGLDPTDRSDLRGAGRLSRLAGNRDRPDHEAVDP